MAELETNLIVTNQGESRSFCINRGLLFLHKGEPVEINSKEILEALSKENDIEIKKGFIKVPRTSEISVEIPKETRTQLKNYKIWELRSIASKMGIKGYFTMKKRRLIKELGKCVV